MAKKKIEKPKRVVTKRQLSHLQRQKRRQIIIRILGISVILAVIGIISSGVYFQWYLKDYKPLKETVVEVNGTKFNMQYYIDMLTFVSGGYSAYASYFTSYALSSIESYELIKQEAEKLGYTISKDEVTAEIKSNNYDNNQAIRDAVRASLLTTKLEEEYFDPLVPTSAEQSYVIAMFLESEVQVEAVKARIAAGEAFGDIAAELSLDSTTQESSGDLGWLPDGVIGDILGTSVLDDLITEAEVGVLSEGIYDEGTTKDVGYWLIKVLETETVTDEETGEESQTATVQAMLLGSEQEAEEVLAQLDAGGDFETLAEEYSQTWNDTDGSELEVAAGDYSAVFEAYALNPDVEIGVVSGILRDEEETTTGGYWLFEVTDRDTLDISDDNRGILLDNKLNEWLEALDYTTNVYEYLDDDMIEFAVSKVAGG